MKKILIGLLICLFLPISVIAANENVILGGDSIGIEAKYNGVYVSGMYSFKIEDKTIDPAKTMHTKDLIVSVNDKTIHNLNDFNKELSHYNKKENKVPIQVIRNDKTISTTLITAMTGEGVQCGLYLKEKVLGIGTLTFYNPYTKRYAALGHPISEDGNHLLQTGNIYESSISNIKKAEPNIPGEKNGTIDYENEIGTIDKNLENGIYGSYFDSVTDRENLPVSNDIKLGKAYFYTVINGTNIEKFTIEIKDVNPSHQQKAISFEITDSDLITQTGGIVHGMSGSPIVQDDKIIGAITHVVIDEPSTGYGILIDPMLEETKK